VKLAIFLLLILGAQAAARGQVSLDGRVTSAEGEALGNINILIYPAGSNVLIAFAVSDAQGHWRTTVNSASDSLDIEASSINYRNERRRIANRPQSVPFELVFEVKQLDAFTIRAPEVERRGDTISYLVSSFAQGQDRAIVDVLRRMPGIEVESSGRILYQGDPIQHLYVEGLDLMGGRYGLVTNNLPHRSVAAVEILENHQPIRILEDRVPSHRASMNLKLQRDITATGTSQLGSGFTPLLWDVNVTPMMFTRNFQLAGSYQANNAGRDASRQLQSLTMQDIRRQRDRPAQNPSLLDIQTLSPPDFAQNRYLDNNIHLLNTNALQRLGRDFQLRANLYYINDSQRQHGIVHRSLYTPTDTLQFSETLENRLHDNYLQGEFTLNRNVKDNYLDNRLRFQTRFDSRRGHLSMSPETLGQRLRSPFYALSNDLRSVKPVGAHLVEFMSYVSWDQSPQSLEVSPGRYQDALFQGQDYERVRQETDLQRLFTDHSASFSFAWRGIRLTPRLGLAYRQQGLDSQILLTHEGTTFEAAPVMANHLDATHTRVYLHTEAVYRRGDLSITTTLPLSWQHLNLEDRVLEQGQQLSRLLADPRLSADYRINGFWRVRGSYNLTHSLGDLDGVHYGYILESHRNLQQNAAPLSEIQRHSLSASLIHRNPITSFFNSANYFFTVSHYNHMYATRVQPDGSTLSEALLLPNTGYTHHLQAQTSKYVRATRSTFALRGSYSHNSRQVLVNDNLFETVNHLYAINPQVNTRITEWLRAEYRANLNYMVNNIGPTGQTTITMLRHFVDLHAFPKTGHYVGLNAEYYIHRDNEHYFLDLLYRYTIRRQRLDLEARWVNIFNTDTYTVFQSGTFSVVESTYMLRPSQLFLSVKFSF
jgi:hypothetical protein